MYLYSLSFQDFKHVPNGHGPYQSTCTTIVLTTLYNQCCHIGVTHMSPHLSQFSSYQPYHVYYILSHGCQIFVPFLHTVHKHNESRMYKRSCYICDLVIIWATLYNQCGCRGVWNLILFSHISLHKRNVRTLKQHYASEFNPVRSHYEIYLHSEIQL